VDFDHVDGFTLSNFLLIFGMWGLIFHETLRFLTITIEGSKRVKPDYIIQILLSLVTAAQLTIFMLQMKYYKRKSSHPFFLSIRGNSLFLAAYDLTLFSKQIKSSCNKYQKNYF
jgi:hypothetical protein